MALSMKEDLSVPGSTMTRSRRDTSEARQNAVATLSGEQADLELFQRVLAYHHDDDWCQLFARFQGLVLSWVRTHPHYDLASRYYEADHYVALAFERLWQATVRNRSLTFTSLGSALSYLKASLNGTILDTLRSYTRPEIPLPDPDLFYHEELVWEDTIADREIWEALKQLCPAPREQRIAYLLFHCGLKPRQIVQLCPDEFPQAADVYRIRNTLVDRLLRHADWLRWRLHGEVSSAHRTSFSPDRQEDTIPNR